MERIRELYERAPYPASPGWGVQISSAWLDGAVHPHGPVMRPGARVLMAGCGAGAEVRAMGDAGLDVIGVDFSRNAVAQANDSRVQHGDLTDPLLAGRLGVFDLVVCNGVADYVPDTAALMHTLAACVAPAGVLFFATNTPYHPRELVLRTQGLLGDRAAAIAVTSALMRDPTLLTWPQVLLDIDVFPAFAHHWPLSSWARLAATEGLHLRSSMTLILRLADVPDEALPALYPVERATLVPLVGDLVRDGGSAALFTRVTPNEPPWADLQALDAWIPLRDASLDGLAAQEDLTARRALTVKYGGWPDLVVPLPGAALELIRRCDAKTPLGALRQGLGEPAPLVAALFRCAHAGLVRLTPP